MTAILLLAPSAFGWWSTDVKFGWTEVGIEISTFGRIPIASLFQKILEDKNPTTVTNSFDGKGND